MPMLLSESAVISVPLRRYSDLTKNVPSFQTNSFRRCFF